MKQGIVKFSKEFITPTGLKEWVTLEWPVDEPFDEAKAMDTFTRVKEFVCNYQKGQDALQDINVGWPNYSSQVPPSPPSVINVQRTSEDTRIAELVRDIYACTQLDGDNGLWSYSKLATTCKEAELAYEVMGKKLRKKESDELLAKSAYINQKQQ